MTTRTVHLLAGSIRRALRPLLPLLLLVLPSACEREHRDFRANAGIGGAADVIVRTELRPGPAASDVPVRVYEDNAWAVSEGNRLYVWFNCAGCHAPGGGGGIGPPLRDNEWIYGASPANIYASIMQGRPNGMPAFRERLDPADAWKLVAYVRSMSRRTRFDTWSPRVEHMKDVNPRRIDD